MTATTIDYYFGCSSPWAYLGHARMLEIAARHGATVQPIPVDYGGIVFPATGGLPLGQRPPARQAYRMLELVRWRERLAVPLTVQPAFFPADDSAVSSRIVALREDGKVDAALALAGAAMRAVWAEERNIADPATIAELCQECGLDAGALSARAEALDCAALRQRDSEAAVARGVFGAPTYVVGDQLLWGQDRLDFLPALLD